MKIKSDLANDPVINCDRQETSKIPDKSSVRFDNTSKFKSEPDKPKRENPTNFRTARTFATHVDTPKRISPQYNSPRNLYKFCVFCEADDHYLPNCVKFQCKPMDSKIKYLETSQRCFKCLRRTHSTSECPAPHKCNVCQKPHPTALHGYHKPKQPVEQTTAMMMGARIAGQRGGKAATTLLPVWVSSAEFPDQEELVYALLDSGSDSTFIDEDVARILELPQDNPIDLEVKTLAGSNTTRASFKYSNLRVRGYENNDFMLAIPPVFSANHLPFPKNSLAGDQVARWDHLKPIASEVHDHDLLRGDTKLGLLIGYNCHLAFIPRKTIVGGDDEPFAMKTDLGWTIIGPTTKGEKCAKATPAVESVTCHRYQVQEVEVPASTHEVAASEALQRPAKVQEKLEPSSESCTCSLTHQKASHQSPRITLFSALSLVIQALPLLIVILLLTSSGEMDNKHQSSFSPRWEVSIHLPRWEQTSATKLPNHIETQLLRRIAARIPWRTNRGCLPLIAFDALRSELPVLICNGFDENQNHPLIPEQH